MTEADLNRLVQVDADIGTIRYVGPVHELKDNTGNSNIFKILYSIIYNFNLKITLNHYIYLSHMKNWDHFLI